MKTLIKTVVLSLLLATSVIAGPSHGKKPVTQQVAIEKANEILSTLIKKGTITKSWSSIKADSAIKKRDGSHYDWLVLFVNESIIDKDKQKIYVFLTMAGDYITVNYTGEGH